MTGSRAPSPPQTIGGTFSFPDHSTPRDSEFWFPLSFHRKACCQRLFLKGALRFLWGFFTSLFRK